VALKRPHDGDASLVPTRRKDDEVIRRFEAVVDAIHDAPDEAAALQAVAAAGRPWPGESAAARAVLTGAEAAMRPGATPDATAPVRAAGSTLGSIAIRWIT